MRIQPLAMFAALSLELCLAQSNGEPAWLKNNRTFCRELTSRANGPKSPLVLGSPKARHFSDYPVRPSAPKRTEPASIGREDVDDGRKWKASIRTEMAKGADFAGRYAIIRWTCGSWCANAALAEYKTRRTFEMPFLGAVGCFSITGDRGPMDYQLNSNLLIVRGLLEVTQGGSFYDGPCGTFYYVWKGNQFRLIGCDIPDAKSPE